MKQYFAFVNFLKQGKDGWLEIRFPQLDPQLQVQLGETDLQPAVLPFLKQGKDGWLEIRFPQLDLQLRVKYADCTKFTPLTYLWREGVHAGSFSR